MKNYKTAICLVLLSSLVLAQSCYAFWVWSPKTKKWVNPSYQEFDTPQQQFDWAMGYFNGKDYSKALSEFKQIIKRFPKSELAPEAKFNQAMCLEKLGSWEKAVAAYQSIIEIYPLNKRLEQIVEQQYLIGEKFFNKKNYYKAKTIFEKALANAPYSSVADVAKYKIGLCDLKVRDYLKARDEFEELVDNYGSSPYVDDASYNVGFCSFKLSSAVKDYDEDMVDRAVKDLEYFTRKYETSEFVPQAESLLSKLTNKKAEKLYRIANFYEKQKKIFAARKYYEQLVDTYPKSDWAKLANKRLQILAKK
jgi:outer membrane assembly lipoprotein YfiO